MGGLTENLAIQSCVNPFSTRRVRPGAIEYRFAAGKVPEELVADFVRAGHRGQVVGPHGSGKSTLLHSLRPKLAEIAPLHWVQIQPSVRRRLLQSPSAQCVCVEPSGKRPREVASIIVIDGFDSLGWLARTAIETYCGRHNLGLLVTTHCDMKLPTLHEMRPNLQDFAAVAHELLQGFPTKITIEEIRAVYQACYPDLREALFQLYDLYEWRRREESSVAVAG